ncbi:Cell surface antigen-like protein Sca8 [Rickettsia akari str. Hartford]|uniref:Cell surface antigen-like protein Sca8 n=1 Tax=Rickettsia akari (strain Hartford) TaxID=293614 RepID=A8GMH6_RICAH|nr:hypothetical protein [Rickettsia akari]ABV74601.1 Cell surface antigen-like protein Sca8 [Rickettsia akari str. Hartford]
MTKNINSKLTKLFLLSCANAAIMTAMPINEDITIADILTKNASYTALTGQAQCEGIKNLVANVNFKTVLEPDRRVLQEIVIRDFDTHNTNLGDILLLEQKKMP